MVLAVETFKCNMVGHKSYHSHLTELQAHLLCVTSIT